MFDAVTYALAKKASSGGSSLPPVTSSDNGKVLAVKDGAWAADSNLFLIEVSGSTANKTFVEITEAINKGRTVVCKKGDSYYNLLFKDEYTIAFVQKSAANPRNWLTFVNITSTNVVNTSSNYLLPTAGSVDNGCELIVSGGNWTKQQKKFIVTLTPTAQDFSGTMDKTVAEINAAYEAGQEIVFRVRYDQTGSYIETPVYVQHGSGAQNEGFFANVCYNDTIIVATTGLNPLPDSTTYSTAVYSLTPAS